MPRVKLAAEQYADKDIVQVIDGTRRFNGLSVEELCQMSGISAATYNRRKKNPRDITIGELRKLFRALRFPAEKITDFIIG